MDTEYIFLRIILGLDLLLSQLNPLVMSCSLSLLSSSLSLMIIVDHLGGVCWVAGWWGRGSIVRESLGGAGLGFLASNAPSRLHTTTTNITNATPPPVMWCGAGVLVCWWMPPYHRQHQIYIYTTWKPQEIYLHQNKYGCIWVGLYWVVINTTTTISRFL